MSADQKDGSFMPSLPLEGARKTLRSIDSAAAEVSISADSDWIAAAPTAVVTAEVMKLNPQKNPDVCHRMGAIFSDDARNLQVLFGDLGAKTVVIQKDH